MDKDLWSHILKGICGGPDMRVPAYPGGYQPPAAGLAFARLVGYFELGQHEEGNLESEMVLRDQVDLVFELSGPNHPPRKLDDGTLIPHRVTVRETLSLDPWANFFKLFSMMNEAHGSFARHMVQMLNKAFVVEVFHRRSKDGKKVYAGLKGPDGYTVHGTTLLDEETGETQTVDVPPAITELKAFIWDLANKAMWDSIHIPGFYEERKNEKGEVISPKRSKNVLQERIMSAKNWPEHPLAELAKLGPDPEAPSQEELERRREAELKEYQARNVKALKDAIDSAIRAARSSNKRPPKST
ncbi:hypothetical protein HHL24_12590 [Paraburkholderia sp. RP-4-7]|uniref:Uncharacterized protein n=1 Tax=Paraburkholderia polaris TaxID=2728848 RepID=A0A848IC83_9BURK|nr:hypothetical protein [Paraburkholderia polaris]NML98782.1 hypothetical protein [Paraburkholderia polaris]